MTASSKTRSSVKIVVAALFVAALGLCLTACGSTKAVDSRSESVYDRVLRTGIIRAGYINYPPGCIKDTKTGELSGIAVDTLRKIAGDLKLNLQFTEEVGWGTAIEGLETNRYDILGSPVWANPVRGKLTTLSNPIYYSAIGVWVRAGETRFRNTDPTWSVLNSPDVRIAAMDGSTPDVIVRTQFPNAKLVSYPDLTGEQNLFLDLTHNKADIFFAEPAVAAQFLKNNPGTIKNIATDNPIRIFPTVYMMKKNESQLKQVVDVAAEDLLNTGFVEDRLRHYEPGPGAFFRVAKGYR